MKEKIAQFCLGNKKFLLLPFFLLILTALVIGFTSAGVSAATPPPPRCDGWKNADLPPCVVPNDSIEILYKSCDDTIIPGQGEVVGRCGEVLVRWSSPIVNWTKEQLADKRFQRPSEYNLIWDAGEGGNGKYWRFGDASTKLEQLIKLQKKCGDIQLKIQIEALCKCPKAPDPECGNPEFCNPFIDVLKDSRGFDRKFNLVNGKFVESKDGSGVTIPADVEDRELVRKGATIAGLQEERTAAFCKKDKGNMRNLKQGKDCSKEPCTWECELNGKVKKCKKDQTIACDGPNGDYISNPYLEYSADPKSPYQQAYADWKSKYSHTRNPFMGGWYNLCLINGKPTNKCASYPMGGGKKSWTCGEDPDKVNCAACIKPACALTNTGKKHDLDAWKKMDAKALKNMLCKDGELVKGPEGSTSGKNPRIYWECRAYCEIKGEKGTQKSFTVGCFVDGGYCGDKEINGNEQCEKDADCGSNAKCIECQCCPNAECGRDTTHTTYNKDTGRMYYLPEPRCISGKQVWDPNPPSPWKFMDYWDEATQREMQYKLWVREDKGWGTAATAAWTCKSKCSEIDCSFENKRCGDGVLASGEQCEKGIACANGTECKMCKCGPHNECETDKDCKTAVKACSDKLIITKSEKCEDVNGTKKCIPYTTEEDCSDKDTTYCGVTDDRDVIFNKIYTCLISKTPPRSPYCGLMPGTEGTYSYYCSDGLDCTGQEGCMEKEENGKTVAECYQISGAPDCSKNTRDIRQCDYAPDSNPFTMDLWYYVSKCEELPPKSAKENTGWKCSEDKVGPSHTCNTIPVAEGGCGAPCNPEDNDPADGRNANCMLSKDQYCQGKKALSPPDVYGTCVNDGSANRSCACDFSGKTYKCIKGSCGANCSEGAKQSCGPGLKGTKTCDKNTCDWGFCIIPTYCGDGTVDKDEQCEPPNTPNNINCSQEQFKCIGKHGFYSGDKGYCNASCGCIADPYIDEGCSDKCTGMTACNGLENGDRASDNSGYCFNCAVEDCTIDQHCTDKYSCNGNDLWKANQKCIANKCQIDPASASPFDKCDGPTYTCDADKIWSYETSEKCVIDNPVNGMGDSGRCEPQAPDERNCNRTESKWDCLEPIELGGRGGILTHFIGKCVATSVRCKGEEEVADRKNCNYSYTGCEGNDVYEYYGRCDMAAQDCLPEDKDLLDTCVETKECRLNELVTTEETCGDLPNGDKGCVAGKEDPFDCAALDNFGCSVDGTKMEDVKGICDPTILDCKDVITPTLCDAKILEKIACGDPLPPPVFGWPDYNPFKRYTQPAWTSMCVEADPDDTNGDKSELPSCTTCNPEQSGSACEMTGKCFEICGADAVCVDKNEGDSCNVDGQCKDCKCVTELSCGILGWDVTDPIEDITKRWERFNDDDNRPIYGGIKQDLVINKGNYCVGADRVGFSYSPGQEGQATGEWTWTCEKTGEDPVNCTAREKGCGYADAERWQGDISYLKGQGAYMSVPSKYLCGSGSVKGVPIDSGYGKWTWNCDGAAYSCSARRQCDFVSTIETVYYNSVSQCWTAEEEKYNNNPSVEWPDAMFCGKTDASATCGRGNDSIDYYSLANITYEGWGYLENGEWIGLIDGNLDGNQYAKDINGDTGDVLFSIIDRDINGDGNIDNQQGICPTGFIIPNYNQWDRLSDAVYDDGNPLTTLEDKVAFNATPGGYWTKDPYDPSDGNYPWHNSPWYFEKDASEKYKAMSSANYIIGDMLNPPTIYDQGVKHQLRCIKEGAQGLLWLKDCIGRGCFKRGGGGLGN